MMKRSIAAVSCFLTLLAFPEFTASSQEISMRNRKLAAGDFDAAQGGILKQDLCDDIDFDPQPTDNAICPKNGGGQPEDCYGNAFDYTDCTADLTKPCLLSLRNGVCDHEFDCAAYANDGGDCTHPTDPPIRSVCVPYESVAPNGRCSGFIDYRITSGFDSTTLFDTTAPATFAEFTDGEALLNKILTTTDLEGQLAALTDECKKEVYSYICGMVHPPCVDDEDAPPFKTVGHEKFLQQLLLGINSDPISEVPCVDQSGLGLTTTIGATQISATERESTYATLFSRGLVNDVSVDTCLAVQPSSLGEPSSTPWYLAAGLVTASTSAPYNTNTGTGGDLWTDPNEEVDSTGPVVSYYNGVPGTHLFHDFADYYSIDDAFLKRPEVTLNKAGKYTFSVTSFDGCTHKSDTIDITYLPEDRPVATIKSTQAATWDGNACSTVTLDASNSNLASSTATPVWRLTRAPGWRDVRCGDTNDCTDYNTDCNTKVSVTAEGATLNGAAAFTATADPLVVTFTPPIMGEYKVMMSLDNGCEDWAEVDVSCECGGDEITPAIDVKYNPSPSECPCTWGGCLEDCQLDAGVTSGNEDCLAKCNVDFLEQITPGIAAGGVKCSFALDMSIDTTGHTPPSLKDGKYMLKATKKDEATWSDAGTLKITAPASLTFTGSYVSDTTGLQVAFEPAEPGTYEVAVWTTETNSFCEYPTGTPVLPTSNQPAWSNSAMSAPTNPAYCGATSKSIEVTCQCSCSPTAKIYTQTAAQHVSYATGTQVFANVELDGSKSADRDGDGLTYLWTVTHADGTTVIAAAAPTVDTTQFTPTQTGIYTVTLVVSDGCTSDTDTTTVHIYCDEGPVLAHIASVAASNFGTGLLDNHGTAPTAAQCIWNTDTGFPLITATLESNTNVGLDEFGIVSTGLQYQWEATAIDHVDAVTTSAAQVVLDGRPATGTTFDFTPPSAGKYLLKGTVMTGCSSDFDAVVVDCECPTKAQAKIKTSVAASGPLYSWYDHVSGTYNDVTVLLTELQTAAPAEDLSTTMAGMVKYLVTVTDPDGATVTDPGSVLGASPVETGGAATPADVVVSPTKAGDYVVTLTVTDGCSTSTDTVTITARCTDVATAQLSSRSAHSTYTRGSAVMTTVTLDATASSVGAGVRHTWTVQKCDADGNVCSSYYQASIRNPMDPAAVVTPITAATGVTLASPYPANAQDALTIVPQFSDVSAGSNSISYKVTLKVEYCSEESDSDADLPTTCSVCGDSEDTVIFAAECSDKLFASISSSIPAQVNPTPSAQQSSTTFESVALASTPSQADLIATHGVLAANIVWKAFDGNTEDTTLLIAAGTSDCPAGGPYPCFKPNAANKLYTIEMTVTDACGHTVTDRTYVYAGCDLAPKACTTGPINCVWNAHRKSVVTTTVTIAVGGGVGAGASTTLNVGSGGTAFAAGDTVLKTADNTRVGTVQSSASAQITLTANNAVTLADADALSLLPGPNNFDCLYNDAALDATCSTDDNGQANLAYTWSLVTSSTVIGGTTAFGTPPAVNNLLANTAVSSPSLVDLIDATNLGNFGTSVSGVTGEYEFQVQVSDGCATDTENVKVYVRCNQAPVAVLNMYDTTGVAATTVNVLWTNAEGTTTVDQQILIDATNSYDPDNFGSSQQVGIGSSQYSSPTAYTNYDSDQILEIDELTYTWSITCQNSDIAGGACGSTTMGSQFSGLKTISFLPDVPGTYTVQLTVSDGCSSHSASVTVIVTCGSHAYPRVVQTSLTAADDGSQRLTTANTLYFDGRTNRFAATMTHNGETSFNMVSDSLASQNRCGKTNGASHQYEWWQADPANSQTSTCDQTDRDNSFSLVVPNSASSANFVDDATVELKMRVFDHCGCKYTGGATSPLGAPYTTLSGACEQSITYTLRCYDVLTPVLRMALSGRNGNLATIATGTGGTEFALVTTFEATIISAKQTAGLDTQLWQAVRLDISHNTRNSVAGTVYERVSGGASNPDSSSHLKYYAQTCTHNSLQADVLSPAAAVATSAAVATTDTIIGVSSGGTQFSAGDEVYMNDGTTLLGTVASSTATQITLNAVSASTVGAAGQNLKRKVLVGSTCSDADFLKLPYTEITTTANGAGTVDVTRADSANAGIVSTRLTVDDNCNCEIPFSATSTSLATSTISSSCVKTYKITYTCGSAPAPEMVVNTMVQVNGAKDTTGTVIDVDSDGTLFVAGDRVFLADQTTLLGTVASSAATQITLAANLAASVSDNVYLSRDASATTTSLPVITWAGRASGFTANSGTSLTIYGFDESTILIGSSWMTWSFAAGTASGSATVTNKVSIDDTNANDLTKVVSVSNTGLFTAYQLSSGAVVPDGFYFDEIVKSYTVVGTADDDVCTAAATAVVSYECAGAVTASASYAVESSAAVASGNSPTQAFATLASYSSAVAATFDGCNAAADASSGLWRKVQLRGEGADPLSDAANNLHYSWTVKKFVPTSDVNANTIIAYWDNDGNLDGVADDGNAVDETVEVTGGTATANSDFDFANTLKILTTKGVTTGNANSPEGILFQPRVAGTFYLELGVDDGCRYDTQEVQITATCPSSVMVNSAQMLTDKQFSTNTDTPAATSAVVAAAGAGTATTVIPVDSGGQELSAGDVVSKSNGDAVGTVASVTDTQVTLEANVQTALVDNDVLYIVKANRLMDTNAGATANSFSFKWNGRTAKFSPAVVLGNSYTAGTAACTGNNCDIKLRFTSQATSGLAYLDYHLDYDFTTTGPTTTSTDNGFTYVSTTGDNQAVATIEPVVTYRFAQETTGLGEERAGTYTLSATVSDCCGVSGAISSTVVVSCNTLRAVNSAYDAALATSTEVVADSANTDENSMTIYWDGCDGGWPAVNFKPYSSVDATNFRSERTEFDQSTKATDELMWKWEINTCDSSTQSAADCKAGTVGSYAQLNYGTTNSAGNCLVTTGGGADASGAGSCQWQPDKDDFTTISGQFFYIRLTVDDGCQEAVSYIKVETSCPAVSDFQMTFSNSYLGSSANPIPWQGRATKFGDSSSIGYAWVSGINDGYGFTDSDALTTTSTAAVTDSGAIPGALFATSASSLVNPKHSGSYASGTSYASAVVPTLAVAQSVTASDITVARANAVGTAAQYVESTSITANAVIGTSTTAITVGSDPTAVFVVGDIVYQDAAGATLCGTVASTTANSVVLASNNQNALASGDTLYRRPFMKPFDGGSDNSNWGGSMYVEDAAFVENGKTPSDTSWYAESTRALGETFTGGYTLTWEFTDCGCLGGANGYTTAAATVNVACVDSPTVHSVFVKGGTHYANPGDVPAAGSELTSTNVAVTYDGAGWHNVLVTAFPIAGGSSSTSADRTDFVKWSWSDVANAPSGVAAARVLASGSTHTYNVASLAVDTSAVLTITVNGLDDVDNHYTNVRSSFTSLFKGSATTALDGFSTDSATGDAAWFIDAADTIQLNGFVNIKDGAGIDVTSLLNDLHVVATESITGSTGTITIQLPDWVTAFDTSSYATSGLPYNHVITAPETLSDQAAYSPRLIQTGSDNNLYVLVTLPSDVDTGVLAVLASEGAINSNSDTRVTMTSESAIDEDIGDANTNVAVESFGVSASSAVVNGGITSTQNTITVASGADEFEAGDAIYSDATTFLAYATGSTGSTTINLEGAGISSLSDGITLYKRRDVTVDAALLSAGFNNKALDSTAIFVGQECRTLFSTAQKAAPGSAGNPSNSDGDCSSNQFMYSLTATANSGTNFRQGDTSSSSEAYSTSTCSVAGGCRLILSQRSVAASDTLAKYTGFGYATVNTKLNSYSMGMLNEPASLQWDLDGVWNSNANRVGQGYQYRLTIDDGCDSVTTDYTITPQCNTAPAGTATASTYAISYDKIATKECVYLTLAGSTAVAVLGGNADSTGLYDRVTITWSFVTKPTSSAATILGTHAATGASFFPDLPGTYSVKATLVDGCNNPVEVTVQDVVVSCSALPTFTPPTLANLVWDGQGFPRAVVDLTSAFADTDTTDTVGVSISNLAVDLTDDALETAATNAAAGTITNFVATGTQTTVPSDFATASFVPAQPESYVTYLPSNAGALEELGSTLVGTYSFDVAFSDYRDAACSSQTTPVSVSVQTACPTTPTPSIATPAAPSALKFNVVPNALAGTNLHTYGTANVVGGNVLPGLGDSDGAWRVQLSASASNVCSGCAAYYHWSVANSGAQTTVPVTLDFAQTANPSFKWTQVLTDTTGFPYVYTVELVVCDGCTCSSATTTTVTMSLDDSSDAPTPLITTTTPTVVWDGNSFPRVTLDASGSTRAQSTSITAVSDFAAGCTSCDIIETSTQSPVQFAPGDLVYKADRTTLIGTVEPTMNRLEDQLTVAVETVVTATAAITDTLIAASTTAISVASNAGDFVVGDEVYNGATLLGTVASIPSATQIDLAVAITALGNTLTLSRKATGATTSENAIPVAQDGVNFAVGDLVYTTTDSLVGTVASATATTIVLQANLQQSLLNGATLKRLPSNAAKIWLTADAAAAVTTGEELMVWKSTDSKALWYQWTVVFGTTTSTTSTNLFGPVVTFFPTTSGDHTVTLEVSDWVHNQVSLTQVITANCDATLAVDQITVMGSDRWELDAATSEYTFEFQGGFTVSTPDTTTEQLYAITEELETAVDGTNYAQLPQRTVFLSASGQHDTATGQGLYYSWSFVNRPTGDSSSTLINADSKVVSFMPERMGLYTVRVTVTDNCNTPVTQDVLIRVNYVCQTPQAVVLADTTVQAVMDPISKQVTFPRVTLEAGVAGLEYQWIPALDSTAVALMYDDPFGGALPTDLNIVDDPTDRAPGLNGDQSKTASFVPVGEGDYRFVLRTSDGCTRKDADMTVTVTCPEPTDLTAKVHFNAATPFKEGDGSMYVVHYTGGNEQNGGTKATMKLVAESDLLCPQCSYHWELKDFKPCGWTEGLSPGFGLAYTDALTAESAKEFTFTKVVTNIDDLVPIGGDPYQHSESNALVADVVQVVLGDVNALATTQLEFVLDFRSAPTGSTFEGGLVNDNKFSPDMIGTYEITVRSAASSGCSVGVQSVTVNVVKGITEPGCMDQTSFALGYFDTAPGAVCFDDAADQCYSSASLAAVHTQTMCRYMCPSDCMGDRGVCATGPTTGPQGVVGEATPYVCNCQAGYTGLDCSKIKCPSDCSGNGVCDLSDGTCSCTGGFGGVACDMPFDQFEHLQLDSNTQSSTGRSFPAIIGEILLLVDSMDKLWSPAPYHPDYTHGAYHVLIDALVAELGLKPWQVKVDPADASVWAPDTNYIHVKFKIYTDEWEEVPGKLSLLVGALTTATTANSNRLDFSDALTSVAGKMAYGDFVDPTLEAYKIPEPTTDVYSVCMGSSMTEVVGTGESTVFGLSTDHSSSEYQLPYACAACPLGCMNDGFCDVYTGTCKCKAGWSGAGCSLKEGCTNPKADNFQSDADVEGASCLIPHTVQLGQPTCCWIKGCMHVSNPSNPTDKYFNYDPEATYPFPFGDDGLWTAGMGNDLSECITKTPGCPDPRATNYDPDTTSPYYHSVSSPFPHTLTGDVCAENGCSHGCLESDGNCDSHASEVAAANWDDPSNSESALVSCDSRTACSSSGVLMGEVSFILSDFAGYKVSDSCKLTEFSYYSNVDDITAIPSIKTVTTANLPVGHPGIVDTCCELPGCMKPFDGYGNPHLNFDATATYEPTVDVCFTTVPGCMDPRGDNYDPKATNQQSDSCKLAQFTRYKVNSWSHLIVHPDQQIEQVPATYDTCCLIPGCMHEFDIHANANDNYDPLATYEPNPEVCFTTQPGCMDPRGDNYDPKATSGLGCELDEFKTFRGGESTAIPSTRTTCCQIAGCVSEFNDHGDRNDNYDPHATYEPSPDTCISTAAGCDIPSAFNYDPLATNPFSSSCSQESFWLYDHNRDFIKVPAHYSTCCMIPGCMKPFDVFGTPNANYNELATYEPHADICVTATGCTDPSGDNYNPLAVAEGPSCYKTQIDFYEMVRSEQGIGTWTAAFKEATDEPTCCDIAGCAKKYDHANNDVMFDNYNQFATYEPSFGYCTGSRVGCTNPRAVNYDDRASHEAPECYVNNNQILTADFDRDGLDNIGGTCCWVPGCTDSMMDNYDPLATFDDLTCFTTKIAITAPAAKTRSGTRQDDEEEEEQEPIYSDNPCIKASGDSNGFVKGSKARFFDEFEKGKRVSRCKVMGCTDPKHTNYDPLAELDDGSCKDPCTNPRAVNYDDMFNRSSLERSVTRAREKDDKGNFVCMILGCTKQMTKYEPNPETCKKIEDDQQMQECETPREGPSINFDPEATYDDGSCYTVDWGCMDPWAMNYKSSATHDDGSCIVLGCMEPTANNYNSKATSNFGCVSEGCNDPKASNYDANALATGEGACIMVGCDEETITKEPHPVVCDPSTGSAESNMVAEQYEACIQSRSAHTANYIRDELIYDVSKYKIINDAASCYQTEWGCTKPWAMNYRSLAIHDDGSCIILGCTSSDSWNYNPFATFDDGTCDTAPCSIDNSDGCKQYSGHGSQGDASIIIKALNETNDNQNFNSKFETYGIIAAVAGCVMALTTVVLIMSCLQCMSLRRMMKVRAS